MKKSYLAKLVSYYNDCITSSNYSWFLFIVALVSNGLIILGSFIWGSSLHITDLPNLNGTLVAMIGLGVWSLVGLISYSVIVSNSDESTVRNLGLIFGILYGEMFIFHFVYFLALILFGLIFFVWSWTVILQWLKSLIQWLFAK